MGRRAVAVGAALLVRLAGPNVHVLGNGPCITLHEVFLRGGSGSAPRAADAGSESEAAARAELPRLVEEREVLMELHAPAEGPARRRLRARGAQRLRPAQRRAREAWGERECGHGSDFICCLADAALMRIWPQ